MRLSYLPFVMPLQLKSGHQQIKEAQVKAPIHCSGLDINPVPRKILAQNLSSFDYRIIRFLVYILMVRNSARFQYNSLVRIHGAQFLKMASTSKPKFHQNSSKKREKAVTKSQLCEMPLNKRELFVWLLNYYVFTGFYFLKNIFE